MLPYVVNERTARAYALARLHEIQDNATRWSLPDATWAEELIRTPEGVWTQAFRLSDGVARSATGPVWIPLSGR